MSSTLWLLKIYVFQGDIRHVLYIMTVEDICLSRGYKTCPLHYDCWTLYAFQGDKRHVHYIMTWRYMYSKGIWGMFTISWPLKKYVLKRDIHVIHVSSISWLLKEYVFSLDKRHALYIMTVWSMSFKGIQDMSSNGI
jgi:hypothetical protein